MLIYHAVQCYNYELRHCWQASSIQDQELEPDILMDVATLEGHESAYRFPEHNRLRYYPTKRETFAKRGLTRNEQLKRAIDVKADFIFFADCDHIYAPNFFHHLAHWLEENGGSTDKVISGRHKVHTETGPTDTAVWAESFSHYVQNSYKQAMNLPQLVKVDRPIAGGAMQVCSVRAIQRRLGGYYIPPDEVCKDKHLFTHGQKARSDVQFRHLMDGSCMIDLPTVVHLGHARDKEEGKHIETQR